MSARQAFIRTREAPMTEVLGLMAFHWPLKPFVVATAIALFTIAWWQFTSNDGILDQPEPIAIIATIIGFASGVSIDGLFFSWLWVDRRLLLWGVSLTLGVWVARFILLVCIGRVYSPSSLIALTLAALALLGAADECLRHKEAHGG